MGGYSRSYHVNASVVDGEDDMSSVMMDSSDAVTVHPTSQRWPSEVFFVLHNHCQLPSVDSRYANYIPKSAATSKTNIISVHYRYEQAVESASRYTQDIFDMDEEDMEWLVLLDWDGMYTYVSLPSVIVA